MTIPVVLASASPARAMLLTAAGVRFSVSPSDVDEEALTAALGAGAAVTDIVRTLAEAKASAVAAGVPSPALVIGCDSMLEFDGAAYGKPGTAEAALARWRLMRGRSGVLHTGHHVIRVGDVRVHDVRVHDVGGDDVGGGLQTASEVVSTRVDFADVTDAEIAAYVATGEPLHVAGAFTLDSLGAAFVTGVVGDHANVVGLSIAALRRLSSELGVAWTDLWAEPAHVI